MELFLLVSWFFNVILTVVPLLYTGSEQVRNGEKIKIEFTTFPINQFLDTMQWKLTPRFDFYFVLHMS